MSLSLNLKGNIMTSNSISQTNVQISNQNNHLTINDYLKQIGLKELGANIYAIPKKTKSLFNQ